ncbi:MAG: UDP-N-acetylmuramoyl-tripeptide--D-alanyl-D-alanine ligase [Lachnospiraceae bacterium]|nr:UDP-N-acetylmuramoyl-tripeptide--D-alanyl-D-alanine ligase [Lachnospiraceae bacterium]
MKLLTLEDISKACCGEYIGDEKKKIIAIDNVVIDSRLVKKGSLFVAIKGEHTDGHKYINNAFAAGAVCAVSEEKVDTDKPYILVKSSEQAIKDIAEYYRGLFDNIEVIGISGSVGKTSTKEMIAAVLSQEYTVHKTQGNFNNELGVPLTLLAMPKDTDVAVVEMGISDFGEMTRLSKMVRPTVCVLTNIGCCHLENLKDRDGVLRAKTEMFNYKSSDALIFVNGDDDKLASVENVTAFYGIGTNNDFYAENINNSGSNSVECTLCFGDTKLDVTVPALGSYMVSNALAAAAVGKSFNMTDENIVKGIESYTTVGSRANLIDTGIIKIIDDCYNANPTSVKAAIDTLCNIDGRHVAVLGDMKELGEKERELHAEVGLFAAEKKVDVLITVGKLAKLIGENAGNAEIHHFDTVEQANDEIDTILHKDDVVLVKASHSMHFEKIVDCLKKL